MRQGRAVCTVSAAALMLGVSNAATIGLHFQPDWTENNSPGYTGFPVTATAFGVAPENWENLTPMPTGYNGSGNAPGPFSLTETITTTTATGGLHPLPQGSITVSWAAVAANTSGFAGNDPGYGGNHPHVGEQEVYYGFLRDDQFVYTHPTSVIGYSVQIRGLKSLFPNSEFVLQLVAATDSGTAFTNAIVTAGASSQSLTYSATRSGSGIFGGVSSVSTALSADAITIAGAPALKDDANGVDLASTLSGIIITDKPLITIAPKTPAAPFKEGDSTTLSVTAIGVPPLTYQWRKDGLAIPGATGTSYTISNVGLANSGHYDVVVSNAYGSATSVAAAVTGDILIAGKTGLIIDSSVGRHHASDGGTAWLASSTDGNGTNRTGVTKFTASQPSLITLAGDTNFDGAQGTISFWVRSAGTFIDDPVSTGNKGAALFDRSGGAGLLVIQNDDGTIKVQPDGSGNSFTSTGTISDNYWHLITVTYDQADTGAVSLYIDGVLDSSNNGNAVAWSWTAGLPIRLGLSSDAYWRPFDGQLDNFRLYSRVLSDGEIAALYATDAAPNDVVQVQLDFNSAPTNGLSLEWLNGGLQAAVNVTGAYTNVPASTSPFAIWPGQLPGFYRTQR
jgi:Concanavalin A-like lectin/glucanases superfamily/Immunoglobulin domain